MDNRKRLFDPERMDRSQLDRHGFTAAPAGVPWEPRQQRATVLPYSGEVHPQLRTDATMGVSVSQSASLPAVFRALSILTGSVAQLPLTVERGGQTLTGRQVPSIIRKPNVDMDQSEFLEQVTLSLAASGNAYLHAVESEGVVINIEVWNPHGVTTGTDRAGRRVYWYNGKSYLASSVQHISMMRLPGQDRGLGPIQAANSSLTLSVRQRDFAAQWFDSTGQPAGILSSDQALTGSDAKAARDAWNNVDEAGNPLPAIANPSRIKVLGKGLSYKDLLISPKDAMWLDAQNFSTLEIARLFGIPTSLLYAALEGNSMTYSNVEQQWLEFVRFTLMSYLRKIENALTALAPIGQRVKFNIEGLLRSDTQTRYTAHETALRAGFLTVNEVRAIEGLPPLTDEQLASMRPTTAPQEADQ